MSARLRFWTYLFQVLGVLGLLSGDWILAGIPMTFLGLIAHYAIDATEDVEGGLIELKSKQEKGTE